MNRLREEITIVAVGTSLFVVFLSGGLVSCNGRVDCAATSTCPPPDGGAGADADAQPPSRPCDPSAELSVATPVPLAVSAYGITLSKNELTAFIASNAQDGDAGSASAIHEEIFIASRVSAESAFGAPIPLKTNADASQNRFPNLSVGDDQLYFASQTDVFVPSTGTYRVASSEIWTATVSAGALTAQKRVVAANVTTSLQSSPTSSTNGLYFARTVSEQASWQHRIWRLDRKDEHVGVAGELVLDVSGGESRDEDHPAVSGDDRTIYFTMRQYNLGGKEIYRATRPTIEQAFLSSQRVPTLTQHLDFVSWVAPDGCSVYGIRGDKAVRVRRPP